MLRKAEKPHFVCGFDFGIYLSNPACRPLSLEDERITADRAYYGDREAFDKLILSNIRWVIAVAQRRFGGDKLIPLDDAVQAGILGLRTAVAKYDPSRGFRVATYATCWIVQSIQREREKYRIIYTPLKSKNNPNNRYRRFAEEAERVIRFTDLFKNRDRQDYGDVIGTMSERGRTYDRPPQDDEPNTDPGWLMRGLNEREKFIIKSRFGLGEKEGTLRDIGKRLKLSKERVRQIEARAINRIKKDAGAQP